MPSPASFALATLLGVAAIAQADTQTLADIKAHDGVLVSAAELRDRLPGAHVTNRLPNGSTRTWTNNPNGSLVLSTDARGVSESGSTRPHFAEGTWRIENDAYCADIKWSRSEEHWCRRIYKVGDKYYGVPLAGAATARAMEFEFKK